MCWGSDDTGEIVPRPPTGRDGAMRTRLPRGGDDSGWTISVAGAERLPLPLGPDAAPGAILVLVMPLAGSRLWVAAEGLGAGGRVELRARQAVLVDPALAATASAVGPATVLVIGIARAALDDLSRLACGDQDMALARLCRLAGHRIDDPVLACLGTSLAEAAAQQGSVIGFIQMQLAQSMIAQLARLGDFAPDLARRIYGGLAPWQERRAREMLRACIATEVDLATIARSCGISKSHFSRAFRRNLGVSPYSWLIRQRIAHAQHLMLSTPRALAEIAVECGFVDQSHFTRIFTKTVAISPRRWRQAALHEAANGEADDAADPGGGPRPIACVSAL